MKKDTINESNLQNRFTAYLMAAVKNKRITYMDKKKRVRENEGFGVDGLTKGYTDFEQEYDRYLCEESMIDARMECNLQKLMKALGEQNLVKALLRLKKLEQEILTARVFGDQDFTEIGLAHGLTAKQAEMAYYYIIRKLRKELEGKINESF